MKQYSTYKDSGIQWIGEIPELWDVKKLKYFAQISNGQDQKEVISDEGKYPILGTGGIFGRATKYLYDQPSVLLGRKGTIDNPFYIEEPFWTVDTLFYTRIHKGVFPKYFYYSCRCIDFDKYKTGSAVPSMTQDTLLNIHRVYPPLPEQIIIATFLDQKTSEIDQLIAAKEELIKKLEVQRKAIINESVTGKTYKRRLIPIPEGIDLKFTDSGIEWLGEIPDHWISTKLKYSIKIQSGYSIDNQELDENGKFPVYGGNGIMGYTNRFNSDQEVLIIGRVGALCGNIHLISGKKWISDNALWATTIQNNSFYKYFLQFLNLNRLANKNAQPLITGSMVKDQFICLPPLSEQVMISRYLDGKIEEFNELISAENNSISLLKQYKQSLISEAVTGKIDVREWQKDETNKIKNL